MLTPAILSLVITNIVVTSAALIAVGHTSDLFSALTSAGRPIEKDEMERRPRGTLSAAGRRIA
jgi:hypothetical protein